MELILACVASANIVVTDEMNAFLKRRLPKKAAMRVLTFHDRPSELFQHLNPEQRDDTRRKISASVGIDLSKRLVLVSATSWTVDEDFALLIDALKKYDNSDQSLDLAVLISGRGPLRAHYEALFSAAYLRKSVFRTLWLPYADFPGFVGMADIGISLHTGHEGLDFPMKVLDMFGCGVPVIACDFQSAREFIVPGQNGLLFKTVDELFNAIIVCSNLP